MKHLKSTITLTAMALLAMGSPRTEATSLPPLINFQSVLLDEGGNLLPSGLTTVQFQILDENREAIYTETQSVEVTKGAVSTLVGNGTDSKGIATGGIPTDVFAAGAPRYLQVQVGTHAPEDPMTIVPVPYAQWSETCATVADGAVSGTKIAKAAVGFEQLAPDVVSKLAAEMSKTQGIVTAQSLNATGGATQIGVEAKFINSGNSTVQAVLQDIDLSVKKSQEMESFLTGKLNDEVTNRTNTVADVQTKLDQEVVNRTTADSGLQGQITKEIKDRGDAVAQEVTNRTTADGGLQGQITKEITDRGVAVSGVQNNLTQEIKDRTTADSGLQSKIDSETVTRSKADDVLQTNINGEGVARSKADVVLQTNINNETTARATADSGFSNTLSNINYIPGTLSFNKVQTSTPPPSDLNMGGHKITNLADPATNQDAATKLYVDNKISGVGIDLAPNPATALIKAGSYQPGGNVGPGGPSDVTIDVGFKPAAIQIFAKEATTDYFGAATDATTIMGVAEYTDLSANKNIIRSNQTLQLNGTKIIIAGGPLNIAFTKFYYTIWGTQ